MPNIPSTPVARWRPFPEKAEPTVTFDVGFVTLQREPLCYSCFHFCNRSRAFKIDVAATAVASVHDEGPRVHSPL